MSNFPVPPSVESQTLERMGAARRQGMPNPIPFLSFVACTGLGFLLGGANAASAATWISMIGGATVGILISSAFRVAAQWEKALVFRLGKYQGTKGPGVFTVMPFFDSVRFVDTRIMTLDIPRRAAITKDNVPVSLDGVIFLHVIDASLAVTRVREFEFAIQQYAQSALRDIVGSMTLDEILADRDMVGQRIESMVETEIDGWGLEVNSIRIQDIELPEDLKRVMARQASAEREKRATITKAEGDRDAAANLAAAATTMATSPGALQLRTLQALEGLGASPSNTIVLAVPVEVLEALRAIPAITQGFTPKP